MSFSFPTPHYEKTLTPHPMRAAAVGMAAAMLALETAATYRSNRRLDDHTDMVSVPRHGDTATYVLPGCRTDGRFLAQALEPHFQDVGSAHYLVYPQKGFSLDAVRDQLLDARERDDGAPAQFYVLSMGGIVLSSLLRDAEFRDRVGPIETIVFDSSPTGAATLTPSTRRAMQAAAHAPRSWSVSHAYTYAMRRRAQRIMAATSPSATHSEHVTSTARTPLHAVSGQTQLIRASQFAPNEMQAAGQEVGRMYYLSATRDEVVNVDAAHQEYEQIYGRSIDRIVDTSRPSPGHAAGPEHPATVVACLTGQYADASSSAIAPLAA